MFVNKVFVIATLAISALAAPAIVELEERAPEPGSKFFSQSFWDLIKTGF